MTFVRLMGCSWEVKWFKCYDIDGGCSLHCSRAGQTISRTTFFQLEICIGVCQRRVLSGVHSCVDGISSPCVCVSGADYMWMLLGKTITYQYSCINCRAYCMLSCDANIGKFALIENRTFTLMCSHVAGSCVPCCMPSVWRAELLRNQKRWYAGCIHAFPSWCSSTLCMPKV